MTPAEFATMLDGMGVRREVVAERCRVHVNSVYAWSSGRRSIVPDRPARVAFEMRAQFDAAVETLTTHALGTQQPIARTSLEGFEALFPDLKGWGQLTQSLVIARAFERAGVGVEFAE